MTDPIDPPANVNPRTGYRRTRVLVLGLVALASIAVLTFIGGIAVVGFANAGIKGLFGAEGSTLTRVISLGVVIGSIVVGGVVLYAELDAFRTWHLALSGPRTSATLTEVRRSEDEGGTSWHLRYEYEVDGEHHGNSASWANRPSAGGEWAVGRHVLIAYDPKRPDRSVML
jgi:hypothetical protein